MNEQYFFVRKLGLESSGVYLSVWLSVTLMYRIEMAKDIKLFLGLVAPSF